jgi:hypothetical protein
MGPKIDLKRRRPSGDIGPQRHAPLGRVIRVLVRIGIIGQLRLPRRYHRGDARVNDLGHGRNRCEPMRSGPACLPRCPARRPSEQVLPELHMLLPAQVEILQRRDQRVSGIVDLHLVRRRGLLGLHKALHEVVAALPRYQSISIPADWDPGATSLMPTCSPKVQRVWPDAPWNFADARAFASLFKVVSQSD